MTIGTHIFTWLHGKLVGRDGEGNRYYQERKAVAGRRRRRWVIYRGDVEASRVPADWHGWLHYSADQPPPPGGYPKRAWQKEHQRNLTGTAAAYRPPGHTLAGGKREKATGDYQAWKPE